MNPKINYHLHSQILHLMKSNMKSLSPPKRHNSNNPSSLIKVDLFQRLRDQPKVTREVMKVMPISNRVKVDPSKNKRKMDETIQTTFEGNHQIVKRKQKVTEQIEKMPKLYTKQIINKEGKIFILNKNL